MKTRIQISAALAEYYSKKFKGKVWAGFDDAKRKYYIRGDSLPACDEMKHLYPNGWSLLDYLTPTKARQTVGIDNAMRV